MGLFGWSVGFLACDLVFGGGLFVGILFGFLIVLVFAFLFSLLYVFWLVIYFVVVVAAVLAVYLPLCWWCFDLLICAGLAV